VLRFAGILAALVIAVTTGGCQGVVVAPRSSEPAAVRQAGPPPHAPAHGYRKKHQSGAELRFDPNLGVYVVVGHTDLYFHDDWFVRIHGGIWQVSTTLSGPWKPKPAEWVPPGLRAKHHAKKSKSRGRGAAKGAW
jgi:hypothetical protein